MNRKRSDQNPTHCARFNKRRNTLVYFSDDNARDSLESIGQCARPVISPGKQCRDKKIIYRQREWWLCAPCVCTFHVDIS